MNVLAKTLSQSPAALGALSALLLLLIAGGIACYIVSKKFKTLLKKALESPEDLAAFSRHYPPEKLKKYSRRMESFARQWGKQIIQDTGLDVLWTERLKEKPRKKDLRRVLLYCPEKNLFQAFLAVQKYPFLQADFINWAREEGTEHVIHRLGVACRGEYFEGNRALFLAEKQFDLLREMTGDPEWYTRYFAYTILLHDDDPRTLRTVEDGLMDSHPLIRKTIAEGFLIQNKEKAYKLLWDRLLHDPVYEVRRSAKKRIQQDFYDLYNPTAKKLSSDEAVRILQLLDESSQEDRSLALEYLKSENRELCYPAAVFLEKCGVLDRLLEENALDDPANLERNYKFLQKAAEVNVSSFLNRVNRSSRPASLFLAAKILRSRSGSQESMDHLAGEVFAFFADKDLRSGSRDLYILTLEAITLRGSHRAMDLFAEELRRRQNQPDFLKLLLPRIPLKADYLFLPVLISFLNEASFPCRDELVNILSKVNPDLLLPEIFKILDEPRSLHPHAVRISALKVLGLLKLPYCLQRVLESLPTLPHQEARAFAGLFREYPEGLFHEKVAALLESPDAQVRASLLTILPAMENQDFLKETRNALRDADPDVRIAAIWSLLEAGEIRLLNQETSMLRDPVERVRLATAQVIGQHGNPAALEILEKILKDPNEVEAVKKSIITGLGLSQNSKSLDLLAEILDNQEEFEDFVIQALTNRNSKRDLTQLVEIFRDASPSMREKLVNVFRNMEEDAEPEILELLRSEVASLKPYLAQILDETGYIEQTIRKLSDKNVKVRREAAQWLSLLGTLSAFRGLVMAAKDPDQEVRVLVVKALEKLNTSQGKEILLQLKEDPDSRIRKYTHWALERLDTLALE